MHMLEGVPILQCHWMYTLKFGQLGPPIRYKARLIIRGNKQNTYVLTASIDLLHVIIHLSAIRGWVCA